MSIEAIIHEIISDAANPAAVALVALLPADRITTGMSHDRDLPYATVNLESDLAEYRANTGSARQPRIRFQYWTESHTDGVGVREAVANLFENKTFEKASYRLETRIENSLAINEDGVVWQFMIDLETKLTTNPT